MLTHWSHAFLALTHRYADVLFIFVFLVCLDDYFSCLDFSCSPFPDNCGEYLCSEIPRNFALDIDDYELRYFEVTSKYISISYHFSALRWRMLLSLTLLEDKDPFITLKPRQNGRHFADDIFKCILVNENVSIPIKISLKFIPKGPNNNIPTLVQIMVWRRPGDKP